MLSLDTQWFSAKGGITTFDRNLAIALARSGAEVWYEVLDATREEEDDARRVGVRLIIAPTTYGESEREALMRRPPLPAGMAPDIVIGHGRVTGPAARALAKDHFPSAARFHIVHTSPDEIEWNRPDRADDAGEVATERLRKERFLARDATRTFAVGPRLHDLYLRELSPFPGVPTPLQIDPGFDLDGPVSRTNLGRSSQIMLLGRLEDSHVKGLDVAARAIAYAVDELDTNESELEVVLRGVPPGAGAQLRDAFRHHAARRDLRVSTRPFSIDIAELRQDQHRASLVIAPSRAEGFGLVGVEAIVAGTPLLVSARSGLGMLLRDLVPDLARHVVLTVDDDQSNTTRVWGAAIAGVLRDPAAAFDRAERLREAMARKRTWAMAADVILNAAADATVNVAAASEARATGERASAQASTTSMQSRATTRYSGRVKWEFYQRLAGDWGALADHLEIPPAAQAGFAQPEGRQVWEWLEVRLRLGDLRDAVVAINRMDLVRLLDGGE
ncbi:glycosyltransferase family 4 protein [Asanoa iriomotensis]|uniref:Bacterial Death-like domain-containing protein n=1 Tax=Asanoa iriomotensis TaxID=234613 RepID=A0ABQ4CBI0_9ACTN|nr:glycosyltransferase family 4 protein [Asanoa iriomotensis]GIF60129.1 hypothetical protein Air01nite_62240 [Asanoa iriomotensis]